MLHLYWTGVETCSFSFFNFSSFFFFPSSTQPPPPLFEFPNRSVLRGASCGAAVPRLRSAAARRAFRAGGHNGTLPLPPRPLCPCSFSSQSVESSQKNKIKTCGEIVQQKSKEEKYEGGKTRSADPLSRSLFHWDWSLRKCIASLLSFHEEVCDVRVAVRRRRPLAPDARSRSAGP